MISGKFLPRIFANKIQWKNQRNVMYVAKTGDEKKIEKVVKQVSLYFTNFKDVNQQNGNITVTLSNGSTSDLPLVLLRDSCQCPKCYDPEHWFRQIPKPVKPGNVSTKPANIRLSDCGTKIIINWNKTNSDLDENHETVIDAKWVFNQNQKLKPNSEINLWTGKTLNQLPTMEFSEFIASDEGLYTWLQLFHQFGFAILRKTPLDDESIIKFANRVAYIRESSFGYVADVRMGPESAIHPSYRGDSLPLHTDLPYREKSPGLLVMHFIKSADPGSVGDLMAGGQSQLSDGFAAAEQLRTTNPKFFDILTKVCIPFAYRDPISGLVYKNQQPTIKLNQETKEIWEIHFSNFARQPMLQTGNSEISLNQFYEALAVFDDFLVENQIEFYAKKGDLIAINNRRLLHGRSSFDVRKVERHMRTCYIDLDEVEAFYQLQRHNQIR